MQINRDRRRWLDTRVTRMLRTRCLVPYRRAVLGNSIHAPLLGLERRYPRTRIGQRPGHREIAAIVIDFERIPTDPYLAASFLLRIAPHLPFRTHPLRERPTLRKRRLCPLRFCCVHPLFDHLGRLLGRSLQAARQLVRRPRSRRHPFSPCARRKVRIAGIHHRTIVGARRFQNFKNLIPEWIRNTLQIRNGAICCIEHVVSTIGAQPVENRVGVLVGTRRDKPLHQVLHPMRRPRRAGARPRKPEEHVVRRIDRIHPRNRPVHLRIRSRKEFQLLGLFQHRLAHTRCNMHRVLRPACVPVHLDQRLRLIPRHPRHHIESVDSLTTFGQHSPIPRMVRQEGQQAIDLVRQLIRCTHRIEIAIDHGTGDGRVRQTGAAIDRRKVTLPRRASRRVGQFAATRHRRLNSREFVGDRAYRYRFRRWPGRAVQIRRVLRGIGNALRLMPRPHGFPTAHRLTRLLRLRHGGRRAAPRTGLRLCHRRGRRGLVLRIGLRRRATRPSDRCRVRLTGNPRLVNGIRERLIDIPAGLQRITRPTRNHLALGRDPLAGIPVDHLRLDRLSPLHHPDVPRVAHICRMSRNPRAIGHRVPIDRWRIARSRWQAHEGCRGRRRRHIGMRPDGTGIRAHDTRPGRR